MSTNAHDVPARSSRAMETIFWAGLIAGVLDLTGACVVAWFRSGVRPGQVFRSVASGIFGASAASGGVKIALAGIALHFFIATTWAAVYFFASRVINFLISQPVIAGVLYGVIVYLFMNFIVIPLSAVPRRPTPPPLSGRIIGMTIIIFCIGLPIALITRRFSKR